MPRKTLIPERAMGDGVKLDKWGYEIRTSSDACIAAINAYYDQVLLLPLISPLGFFNFR